MRSLEAKTGLMERIQNFFFGILDALLPVYGKRIFFVTTLYMQMKNLVSTDDEGMTCLEDLLNLATTTKALELPAVLHQRIWEGRPVDEVLRKGVEAHEKGKSGCADDHDVRQVCETIVDMAPRYLRYGRREDMVNDVCRLFDVVGREHPAAC